MEPWNMETSTLTTGWMNTKATSILILNSTGAGTTFTLGSMTILGTTMVAMNHTRQSPLLMSILSLNLTALWWILKVHSTGLSSISTILTQSALVLSTRMTWPILQTSGSALM
jgi:hypothetical protein